MNFTNLTNFLSEAKSRLAGTNITNLLRKISTYHKGLIAIFLTWGTYFLYLWPKLFHYNAKGDIISYVNMWADWSAHFGYAAPFAYRPIETWFESHPFFILQRYTYPFVVNAISGLLIRMGVDQVAAFIVPSILATLFLLFIIYKFSYQILNSSKQAYLAVMIFFCSGGLGFMWFLSDVLYKKNFWAEPLEDYSRITDSGIYWFNIITTELIPQRAFLLGLPIALALLYIFIKWIGKNFEGVKPLHIVLLGMGFASLLVIHTHSFIAVFFILASYSLFNYHRWEELSILAAATGLTAIFLYILFLSGGVKDEYFRIQLGWLSNNTENKDILLPTAFVNESKESEVLVPFVWLGNFLMFWILNWGIFLPFAIFSIVKTKMYRHPLVVSGIAMFVVSNIIRFQPWDWDNSKILTWSYFILSMPVASYLAILWRTNILKKMLVIILTIGMCATGFLTFVRLLDVERISHTMWTADEIALAKKFRESTDPRSIVLTSDDHHHWVAQLTGRRVLIGYKGWLWSYGFNYNEVDQDIQNIYRWKDNAKSLIEKYGIDYIVIGPSELNDPYNANEEQIATEFPLFLENDKYRVYWVKDN